MKKRVVQVAVGLAVAALFLYLSFKDVALTDLLEEISQISLWWVLPYFLIVLTSNLARAERWKMLLDDETGKNCSRRVMLSGVMYGYIVNMTIPRAGEVFRAVYASRKSSIESPRLFGTIILERVIDVGMMVLMLLITFIVLVNDPSVLTQIFGPEGAATIIGLTSSKGLLLIATLAVFALFVLLYLRKSHQKKTISGDSIEAERSIESDTTVVETTSRVQRLIKNFVRGVISVRKLQNWPLFVFYTLYIWFTYIVTSLLPFYAFGFVELYGFGWEQAFVITVIGAVGVALPSPGGVGTYHYMVQSGLVVLYSVPVVSALSYATISHFVNIICLIVISILLFLYNNIKSDQTQG